MPLFSLTQYSHSEQQGSQTQGNPYKASELKSHITICKAVRNRALNSRNESGRCNGVAIIKCKSAAHLEGSLKGDRSRKREQGRHRSLHLIWDSLTFLAVLIEMVPTYIQKQFITAERARLKGPNKQGSTSISVSVDLTKLLLLYSCVVCSHNLHTPYGVLSMSCVQDKQLSPCILQEMTIGNKSTWVW